MEIIYSSGKHVGPSSKRPSITTNEGPPNKRVTIKCNILRQADSTYPLTITPYKLFVSKAGEVEIDEATFTLTNVSDQDLDIAIVSQPYHYFALDIPQKIAAGQAAECKLKVNPNKLGGSFEKSITLELSDPSKTRFTIPIVRRLIGQKAAAPQAGTPQTPKTGH